MTKNMKKVTNNAVNAFMNDKNFASGNTSVIANGAITSLYLHGNLIAERNRVDNTLQISSAGWETNTTKERLNGLPGVRIHQKDFVWYLNGEVWNKSSKLTYIK